MKKESIKDSFLLVKIKGNKKKRRKSLLDVEVSKERGGDNMETVHIYFVDGEDATLKNTFVSNFDELCVWLQEDDSNTFKVIRTDNQRLILYKHAIKYVKGF